MSNIPREKAFDSTLDVMADGYTFISKRCKKYKTDIFRGRLMGQKAVFISGEEAAAVFYDPDLFKRQGAIPKRVQKTLVGEGGVQTLDGASHRHRKEMFMSLMSRKSIEKMIDLTAMQWQTYIRKWEAMHKVVLFDEVKDLLCEAACVWTGVPLSEAETRSRSNDLWALVDAFSAVGPRHWRGRRARNRSEKWIEGIVDQYRNGTLEYRDGSPAQLISLHRDLEGNLLDRRIAAVEILNLIRPIVAITNYIIFSAHALHRSPKVKQAVKEGDKHYLEMFVQEVRRYYPFGPFTGAIVKKEFEWKNYTFRPGTMVLLDMHGNNHSAKLWKNPEQFDPENFRNWKESSFDFIPQGGGSYLTGHRCAGEWITIEVMKVSVNFLVNAMEYEVPNQDLAYSLVRIPSMPKSRFVIRHVVPNETFRFEAEEITAGSYESIAQH